MPLQTILNSLRPKKSQTVYDSMALAGLDVTPWTFSKPTGEKIDPYQNTYRNSQWTFKDSAGRLAASFWWPELLIKSDRIVREGNSNANATDWGIG